MLSQSYIILRIQRLEGKQCRSRWGGSLWATSSRSTLFANSVIFVSGTYTENQYDSTDKLQDTEAKLHVVKTFKWFNQILAAMSMLNATVLKFYVSVPS